jgi:hypothetical protein
MITGPHPPSVSKAERSGWGGGGVGGEGLIPFESVHGVNRMEVYVFECILYCTAVVKYIVLSCPVYSIAKRKL